MPATLRRHPTRFTLLAVTAALLAMPAPSLAKTKNPLAGARLTSAVGSVTIKTIRCPAGLDRTSPKCGRSELEIGFTSSSKPTLRRLSGNTLRIGGKGRSQCGSASPAPDPVSLPDGSMQLQGPATHYTQRSFATTDIQVATTAKTARWTWLEPTMPTVPCDYFFGDGATSYPETATSPRFGASILRKRRFNVTLEADLEEFERSAPDGGKIFGDASWTLKLAYRRG